MAAFEELAGHGLRPATVELPVPQGVNIDFEVTLVGGCFIDYFETLIGSHGVSLWGRDGTATSVIYQ